MEQVIKDKHPKGLMLLAGTELGERFSFYGMRVIFMLYMLNALQLGTETTGSIYGWYIGMVYMFGLVGGYVADRFWGQQKAIIWGGILIAIGQFAMGFHSMISSSVNTNISFLYFSIGAIIVGVSLLKPNISAIIGGLYEQNDARRDGGFTLFYMGINIGALLATLIVPFIAEEGRAGAEWARWHYGYFSAGIVMVIALLVFLKYRKSHIGEIGNTPTSKHPVTKDEMVKTSIIAAVGIGAVLLMSKFNSLGGYYTILTGLIIVGALAGFLYYIYNGLETVEEKRKTTVIFVLAFFTFFFWSAFEQAGGSLTIFADRQTDRTLPFFIPFIGKELPAGVFQAINPFMIIILAPFFSKLWIGLAKKNMDPSTPMKFVWGLALLALGFLFMIFGAMSFMKTGMKVGISFLLFSYFFQTVGEICLSPVGLSMVTKLAPSKFVSLLMGFWFVAIGSANYTAGLYSGMYDKMALDEFFMIPTATAAIAALILLIIYKPIKKWMGNA